MITSPTPIALVTGSAKRLGRAMALALAEDGFDVALHYNSSTGEVESLQAEIEAMGRQAVTLAADLADPEKTPSLIEKACDKLGPLTLLINSASVLERDGLLDMWTVGSTWSMSISHRRCS